MLLGSPDQTCVGGGGRCGGGELLVQSVLVETPIFREDSCVSVSNVVLEIVKNVCASFVEVVCVCFGYFLTE